MENFTKTLDYIAMRHGHSETLKAFLSVLVNFFADGKYSEERDKHVRPILHSKDELNKAFFSFFSEYEEILSKSSREWIDPLGELYEDWTGKQKRDGLGQFFTPPDICTLMANITIEENAVGTCCEPASGSARTILAAHARAPALEFTAIEKDYTCFLLSAVNMFLNGCIGQIIWGDTLKLELWQGLEIVRTVGPISKVAPLVIVPFQPTAASLQARSERPNPPINLIFEDSEEGNQDQSETRHHHPAPPMPKTEPPTPAQAKPATPTKAKPDNKPSQLTLF